MPTNAEIKALINTRVRAQRSHILNDSVAEILDFMVDNIDAGPGGTPTLDEVLISGATLTDNRTIDLNGKVLKIIGDQAVGGVVSIGDNAGVIENLFEVHFNGVEFLGIDVTGFNSQLASENGIAQSTMTASSNVAGNNVGFEFYTSADDIEYVDMFGNGQTGEYSLDASGPASFSAPSHTFTGDFKISTLAGGGTTGLSIDNDGKIIRTP